jgi:ribonuclease P protein component
VAAKQVPNGRPERFLRSSRLLKHADFQLVYQQGRKSFSGNVTALYRERDGKGSEGPRVGFAVGKMLGGAVERNRIRRRMREAVRKHLPKLSGPVDVVLHPRKSVSQLDFRKLDAEIQQLFAAVQKGARR